MPWVARCWVRIVAEVCLPCQCLVSLREARSRDPDLVMWRELPELVNEFAGGDPPGCRGFCDDAQHERNAGPELAEDVHARAGLVFLQIGVVVDRFGQDCGKLT